MTNNLILLWLAAFPLMGSPGPATISLAGVGTAYGFRKGRSYLLGIIAGTFGVLIVVASGVSVLVQLIPGAIPVLTVIAALYIVYLAWNIATAPVGTLIADNQGSPTFPSGLFLSLANPKAFAAIGAVYSGHSLVENNVFADSLSKIVALFLVIVCVNTAWLAFGASLSRFLSGPNTGRLANIGFALLLIVSVGFALFT